MHDHASHHDTPHALEPAPCGPSYLGRVDPRVRVVAAVGFAVAVAAAHSLATAAAALGVALLALGLARISPSAVLRRILPLEIVILLVALALPWTAGPSAAEGKKGTVPICRNGPEAGTMLAWSSHKWGLSPFSPDALSRAGPALAAAIALKANAIVLGLLALLGGMEAATLGHALAHLRVPKKFIHLLLMTTGYLEVLRREYGRLRGALRVRCFRPHVSGHTYRTYGYLVGMLLVRSFERAERVLAAMKCRGFRGRFYLLDHFSFVCRRDVPFSLAAAALLAGLLALEWF
jgi:cobalt/nickel transport system permease protein